MPSNSSFGTEGLRCLVQGMTRWKQVSKLDTLDLADCGLGGKCEFLRLDFPISIVHIHSLTASVQTATTASLRLLSQLLRLAPSLNSLKISENDLWDLSPAFITSIFSHPTLEILNISSNERLGILPRPSAPCAIHRFLSQLIATASSFTLKLRDLAMFFTGTSHECCCPLLEEAFSLGPKGLRFLQVGAQPPNIPHYQVLVDTVVNNNFFIQGLLTASLSVGGWGEN